MFGPASKLDQIAKRLLAGNTETIAEEGRQKLLEFHTSAARAQVVLDHLESAPSGTIRLMQVFTAAEQPELDRRADALSVGVWPEYNLHGDVLSETWG